MRQTHHGLCACSQTVFVTLAFRPVSSITLQILTIPPGRLLTDHPDVAGVTFTGSYGVGMQISQKMTNGPYLRPCIAEMGGKNACIVTANGDLERAALGILRSAFGLSGEKCSALSRVYVEESVADALLELLQPQIQAIKVGDPTQVEKLPWHVLSMPRLTRITRLT